MAEPTTLASIAVAIGNAGVAIANTADTAKRQAQLIEFQQAIIQLGSQAASIQALNSSLTAHNQELEKEVVRMKDWSAEASNYEVTQVARGLFAYVAKGNVEQLSATKKLCSNCFHERFKSFLQEGRETVPPRNMSLTCHRCKSTDGFRAYIDGS